MVHTGADKVLYASFLPLEEISPLATAEVKHCGSGREVGANDYTLHPVVKVPHVEYRTLESMCVCAGGGGRVRMCMCGRGG